MQWDRHLRALLRLMTETPAEATQREVQEIAEVLSRQSGRLYHYRLKNSSSATG